jgi:hypothetical protein
MESKKNKKTKSSIPKPLKNVDEIQKKQKNQDYLRNGI